MKTLFSAILLATLAMASRANEPATPKPGEAAEPVPSKLKTEADTSGQVTILCYHRFEERPKDGLAITPSAFRQEMQALKDNGVEVISMADFLAWQKGEKSIPKRAAIITMDDGYDSCKDVAWPILKEFGYPFTMFIYTDYVRGGPRSGGKSLSWAELKEMQVAGVEFGSHSLSHSALNAKKGRSDEEYREWLKQELGDSKAMLEQNLGIPITVIAYPYGLHNETVREVAREVGYEMGLTVAGKKINHGVDLMQVGRYAMDSTKPGVFKMAANFGAGEGPASSSVGTDYLPMTPASDSKAEEALPLISVDFSSLGQLESSPVEMVITGLGAVPAEADPATGLVSYQLNQRLYGPEVTVTVSANVGGKKVKKSWRYQPNNEAL